jgi:hypothetical protein
MGTSRQITNPGAAAENDFEAPADVEKRTPGRNFSPAGPAPSDIRVARNSREARRYVDDWEDLAEAAVEPNVFYEPWMLIPAMDSLSRHPVQLVFVYGRDDRSAEPGRRLIGLFPLEYRRGYRGVPLPYLSLWRHAYAFLTTPLVRRGQEETALNAFFTWLDTMAPGQFFRIELLRADGPLAAFMMNYLKRSDRTVYEADRFGRALIQPADDAETYIRNALVRKRRKEINRLANRLSETGAVELAVMGESDNVDGWIEEFLSLEASGWKGKAGTAFASDPRHTEYFRDIARAAFRRGQLMMLMLKHEGRPIAIKVNFVRGEGAYAFKIAYDEEMGQYSPGVLLEMEHIKYFHTLDTLMWVDSCAKPDHIMIDRLWTERREIVALNISKRRLAGDMLIASEPVVKRIYKKLIRRERA